MVDDPRLEESNYEECRRSVISHHIGRMCNMIVSSLYPRVPLEISRLLQQPVRFSALRLLGHLIAMM